MRTEHEIKKMFEDMGLETEEKRSRFLFSFSYSSEQNHECVPFIHVDTKTKELKGEENAELERNSR
jgi:hypothetical protein